MKPVAFNLGEQIYGLDINTVSAIENNQSIVPVPNSVPYIKGIINLRGDVIPVFNLRKKFSMPDFNGDVNLRKLIIVKISDVAVALEVDGVSEIREISDEQIVSMPQIVVNDEIRYFKNVARVDNKLIVLIDVNYLLTNEEISGIKKMKEDLK